MRSGATLDARVLQVANQIARQQQAQIADSQRQPAAPPAWLTLDDEPADATFRRVE